MERRAFLRLGGAAAAAAAVASCERSRRAPESQTTTADYSIRIAPGLIELAPDRIIATTLYNNQFPGPLLRFREGKPVTVDVFNDTDTPEQLHWHGQFVDANVDGAAEEGTPFIAPHGHRRMTFTPGPAGVRFYHTHAFAGADLRAGLYGGQVGPVYIEPRDNPGAYDQELFLLLKEFEPAFSRGGDMAMNFLAPSQRDKGLESQGESAMRASLAAGSPHGFEVGYDAFSINGRMLGHGDPIRVKAGERVLLHVINGSATEIRSLALPDHMFEVVALDGNAVPTPVKVPVLWIGTGERVSAVLTMTHPGVWVLGDVSDDRERGCGIVVQYAGATGKPRWTSPPPFTWDYTAFGKPNGSPQPVDESIDLVFRKENAAAGGFNRWLVNDQAFSMTSMAPRFRVKTGMRYRLRMKNATDDIHPIHLHRHSLELTKVAGRPTNGIIKDVVMLGGYQELEADFTAAPGLSLFHCHMQLHMDYGFMALIDC